MKKTERNLEMEKKKRELELNIKDLGTVLLRCWWIMLIAGVVVAAGLYLVLFATHTDEYTATVPVYVMREALIKNDDTGTNQLQGVDVSISNNIKADVLVLPYYHTVLDDVLTETLHQEVNETNFNRLKNAISTESKEEEHIVNISVTATDPHVAYEVAGAVAKQTGEVFNTMLFGNEKYVTVLDKELIEPETPSNPISKVLVILVGVGTMLIVYLVFLILFLADDKVNDADDVKSYLGVSTLGQIPNRRETGRHRKKYGKYYGKYYQTYEAEKPGEKNAENGKKGDAKK